MWREETTTRAKTGWVINGVLPLRKTSLFPFFLMAFAFAWRCRQYRLFTYMHPVVLLGAQDPFRAHHESPRPFHYNSYSSSRSIHAYGVHTHTHAHRRNTENGQEWKFNPKGKRRLEEKEKERAPKLVNLSADQGITLWYPQGSSSFMGMCLAWCCSRWVRVGFRGIPPPFFSSLPRERALVPCSV